MTNESNGHFLEHIPLQKSEDCRDVASTTTVKYKYKYKYKYLGLKYKYKYKYLGLKYKYKYLVVTASTGQVHNSQCMLSFCFVNYVA